MKIRNGKTPITNLPLIKAGDPITARWANSVTRAIEELKRRTPVLTGVMPRGNPPQPQRLPFEVFTRGQDLVAAPGTIDFDSFPETIEAAPADGMWYFQAKVTINGDTGVVTAREAFWSQTLETSTGVIGVLLMGQVEVVDSSPVLTSVIVFNYGPVLTSIYGGITERWNIQVF